LHSTSRSWTALPTAIRIGKVGLDAKGLIDGLVIGIGFIVVFLPTAI
jgi:hypothetical protein